MNNLYILRAHGYLNDTSFEVPENYGFITFCKQGTSRSSDLNDLLIKIISKNLNKINENKYEENPFIGDFINNIFLSKEINSKFKNYLILKTMDIELNQNFEAIAKITNDEELEIFSNKDLFRDILNNNKVITHTEYEILKNKMYSLIDYIIDEDYIDDNILSEEVFKIDYFSRDLITSFEYLIENLSNYDINKKLLKKLYLMIKYTKYYGPGSVIQDINFNIIGFYDSCEKIQKKYTHVRKSGLISFNYLKQNSIILKKDIPCEYGVNKKDRKIIKDIFYFEKYHGKIYLRYIDIFNEDLNGDDFDTKCSDFLSVRFKDRYYSYIKTIYYKVILNQFDKENINFNVIEDYIFMWRLNNGKLKKINSKQKKDIEKKNLHEKYRRLMELVKKIICESIFTIYSFFYQVFDEENSINMYIKNNILSNINEIIFNFENNPRVNLLDPGNPNDFIQLVEILNEITDTTVRKYRKYTKNSLKKLIKNFELENRSSKMYIEPGIYLLPSCKKGEAIDETTEGNYIFDSN